MENITELAFKCNPLREYHVRYVIVRLCFFKTLLGVFLINTGMACPKALQYEDVPYPPV